MAAVATSYPGFVEDLVRLSQPVPGRPPPSQPETGEPGAIGG
jgi:hypothetical protein